MGSEGVRPRTPGPRETVLAPELRPLCSRPSLLAPGLPRAPAGLIFITDSIQELREPGGISPKAEIAVSAG